MAKGRAGFGATGWLFDILSGFRPRPLLLASGPSGTSGLPSLQAFFEQHPVPGLERSVAQVVEAIRTEAKFVTRLEQGVEDTELKDAAKSVQTPHSVQVLQDSASCS